MTWKAIAIAEGVVIAMAIAWFALSVCFQWLDSD